MFSRSFQNWANNTEIREFVENSVLYSYYSKCTTGENIGGQSSRVAFLKAISSIIDYV